MLSASSAAAWLGVRTLTLLPAGTTPGPSPSPREFNDDNVQPGPVPLAVIVILLLASWLLVRSMRTHLRRIPADLDVQVREPRATETMRPDSSAEAAEPDAQAHETEPAESDGPTEPAGEARS